MENLGVFDCSNILVASYFDSGNPENGIPKLKRKIHPDSMPPGAAQRSHKLTLKRVYNLREVPRSR